MVGAMRQWKGKGGVGMEWDSGSCKLDYSQDSLSHCPHAYLVSSSLQTLKGSVHTV